MTTGNFVFDIDGAIAIAATYQAEKIEAAVKAKLGDAYFAKHCLTACNYPHYIFPGYYALFKWLHQQGGKVYFFSSGVEERNVELVEKMMQMSFGDAFKSIDYKVFSRQHCIDTTGFFKEDEMREKYQSFFYGQKKKKLGGIVVPEEDMPNTLLIDDDTSYMVKGEEYNFISIRDNSDYLQEGRDDRSFVYFHKALYLAGLFSTLFDLVQEQGMSLMEAAKFVQIDSEGVELSSNFYYPGKNRRKFFIKGFDILKKIDPTLELYYNIAEDRKDDW
jgi:hypothetical protein